MRLRGWSIRIVFMYGGNCDEKNKGLIFRDWWNRLIRSVFVIYEGLIFFIFMLKG